MISIVIPTWNEESVLESLLVDLSREEGAEIIVADGGSTDHTLEIARHCALVVETERNRGKQLNTGAAAARGDSLLFLHADARFPQGGVAAVRRALADTRVVGGTFSLRYAGDGAASRVFTRLNTWRRAWGIFYGDAGIFARRGVFWRLGGFRPLPVLDDYEFARRLVRAGKTVCLPQVVEVSARRWEGGRLLPTIFSWAFIQGLYWLGVSPERLARLYPPIRCDSRR